jgi:hypothetical protein
MQVKGTSTTFIVITIDLVIVIKVVLVTGRRGSNNQVCTGELGIASRKIR